MFGNISVQARVKVCPVLPVMRPRHMYKRPRYQRSVYIQNILDTAILQESFNVSVKATVSKMAALYFTYPLETCKIYRQLDKKWDNCIQLYQGFPVFLLTATFQCFINYNVFFYLIKTFTINHNMNNSMSIFYGSILSCFLTSFLKVHTTFIAKNIIFIKNNDIINSLQEVMSFMTWQLYTQSWLSNLISDIPDSFVKFCLNSLLITTFPNIHTFSRSLITSMTAAIVNMPLDYWLTLTMCKTATSNKGNMSLVNHGRNCFAGFNYRIMASMIGNIIFFNIFNTLQPAGI